MTGSCLEVHSNQATAKTQEVIRRLDGYATKADRRCYRRVARTDGWACLCQFPHLSDQQDLHTIPSEATLQPALRASPATRVAHRSIASSDTPSAPSGRAKNPLHASHSSQVSRYARSAIGSGLAFIRNNRRGTPNFDYTAAGSYIEMYENQHLVRIFSLFPVTSTRSPTNIGTIAGSGH
jgi:hypothetical protein